MQIDPVNLCLVGIIIVAVLILVSRMMRSSGGQQVDYSQRGNEQPRYNDPNITSRGGFGGQSSGGSVGSEHPQYDDRNIESRGGFGHDRPNETPDRESHNYSDNPKPPLKGGGVNRSEPPHSSQSPRPSHDDPDVESHGGFGRPK